MKEIHLLDELAYRDGLLFDSQRNWRHQNLKRGEEGEDNLLNKLLTQGHEDWIVLADFWLNHYSNEQIDFLVMMQNVWLHIEVKNHSQHIRLKDNQCWINGKTVKDNIFHKMQYKIEALQAILKASPVVPPIYHCMVFMDERCEVSIEQSVNYDVIRFADFETYLGGIIRKNENYYGPHPNNKLLLDWLLNKEIPCPFPVSTCDNQTFAQLRKGIHCGSCRSYNIELTKLFVKCRKCGSSEKKEHAVVRTICQLGVIMHHRDRILTRQNIMAFLEGQVSLKFLLKVLKKYFVKVPLSQKTYYVNPKLPYHVVKDTLKHPVED